MIVHLLDGTYELFRHFYGIRRFKKTDPPFGAVSGVLATVAQMLDAGEPRIAVSGVGRGNGQDGTGETGISNAGLIVGQESAVAVDALMVPSMTRRLVAAIKKTTKKPVAQLINTHHHVDHTGGNRAFRPAAIIATEKCRAEMEPGFPPAPVAASWSG